MPRPSTEAAAESRRIGDADSTFHGDGLGTLPARRRFYGIDLSWRKEQVDVVGDTNRGAGGLSSLVR